MRILKRIFILWGIILFFNSFGFSQNRYGEGYVTIDGNDTIQGYLEYKANFNEHQSFRFKKLQHDAASYYNISEITGFGFYDGRHYKVKETLVDSTQKKIVLEILIDGYLKLYKYSGAFFLQKDTSELFKLSKQWKEVTINGRTEKREDFQFRGILSALLSDCEIIVEDLKKVTVSDRSLEIIVTKYNSCHGSENKIYKNLIPWVKPNYGVLVGFSNSKISFTTNTPLNEHLDGQSDTSNSLMFGISFDFLFPRTADKFSIQSDILFLKRNFEFFNSTDFIGLIENRYYTTIELTDLKIPVGIQYQLTAGSLSPYLSAGFSTTFHIQSSSLLIKEKETSSGVEVTTTDALEIRNPEIGFYGGLGIAKSFTRFGYYFEARFETTRGITSNSLYLNSKVTNFQVLFGIKYLK